ncbi:hypothetical protein DFQ28_002863 [Apophysomyces sp. BC1034]|nr:hypothetical protein DFQ30_003215 [Apophysomyces sp. BC1015]KAG0179377.1 hypothetical protein DFQ29_002163 [Apophysomyces sp. BC1021]KAG0189818.1 hypothetical protein DFQ28_002863 [Apophysomyces sp. BC1034]
MLVSLGCSMATVIRLPLSRTKIPKRMRRDVSYAAGLYNDDGSEYLMTVGIGTPPQNFTVAVDTGSADLWVPSVVCTTDCPLEKFDANRSSTFEHVRPNFGIVYGIGQANGSYGRDVVHIAGAQVPHQQFGLAETTNDIILDHSGGGGSNSHIMSNGILGLGFPALASSPHDPVVFNLVKQGLIDNAVFSFYMGSMYDPGWAGEIILGGIDHDKYIGDLHYLPVARKTDNYTYWMVNGQGIQIQDNKTTDVALDAPFPQSRRVIIDTGTTLTYLDKDLAERIVMAVAGHPNKVALDQATGTYILDCGIASSPLQIQFAFADKPLRLRMPVRDLVIPLDADDTQDATQCMFGIAPWLSTGGSAALSASGMILLGDSVLRSTYLVFDIANHQIGFGRAISTSGTALSLSISVDQAITSSSPPPRKPLHPTISWMVFLQLSLIFHFILQSGAVLSATVSA